MDSMWNDPVWSADLGNTEQILVSSLIDEEVMLPRRSSRERVPNTQVDFTEYASQQATRRRQSIAAKWSRAVRDLELEIDCLEADIDTGRDVAAIEERQTRIEARWSAVQTIYSEYIPDIMRGGRRENVVERFVLLKKNVANAYDECAVCTFGNPPGDVDEASNRSDESYAPSNASSSDSKKEKLKAALVAKKRLELAQARADAEAEEVKRKAEDETRREIRRLEEAVALAELEWKIERDYDEQTGQVKCDVPMQVSPGHSRGLLTVMTEAVESRPSPPPVPSSRRSLTPGVSGLGPLESRPSPPPVPSPRA